MLLGNTGAKKNLTNSKVTNLSVSSYKCCNKKLILYCTFFQPLARPDDAPADAAAGKDAGRIGLLPLPPVRRRPHPQRRQKDCQRHAGHHCAEDRDRRGGGRGAGRGGNEGGGVSRQHEADAGAAFWRLCQVRATATAPPRVSRRSAHIISKNKIST